MMTQASEVNRSSLPLVSPAESTGESSMNPYLFTKAFHILGQLGTGTDPAEAVEAPEGPSASDAASRTDSRWAGHMAAKARKKAEARTLSLRVNVGHIRVVIVMHLTEKVN